MHSKLLITLFAIACHQLVEGLPVPDSLLIERCEGSSCISRRDDPPPPGLLLTPNLFTQPAYNPSGLTGPIAQSVTEYPTGLASSLSTSTNNAGKTAGTIIPAIPQLPAGMPALPDLKGAPMQLTKTIQPPKKQKEEEEDDDSDEEESDDEDSDDEDDDED